MSSQHRTIGAATARHSAVLLDRVNDQGHIIHLRLAGFERLLALGDLPKPVQNFISDAGADWPNQVLGAFVHGLDVDAELPALVLAFPDCRRVVFAPPACVARAKFNLGTSSLINASLRSRAQFLLHSQETVDCIRGAIYCGLLNVRAAKGQLQRLSSDPACDLSLRRAAQEALARLR